MSALGVAAWAALHLLAPILVTRVLNVPTELRDEAVGAFRILALAVPFVVSTAGLRGLLEAVQRFDFLKGFRVATGTAVGDPPVA
jgi:O-antigen/teichoic acid export membrane protein